MSELRYLPKKIMPKQGFALLAASILLHLCFISWAGGRVGIPEVQSNLPNTVEVKLRPAIMPLPATSARVPKVKKPRISKPVTRPELPATTLRSAGVPALPESPPPEAMAVMQDEVPPTLPVEVPAVPTAGTLPAVPEPPKETTNILNSVNAPPSVELRYKVEALREGQTIYGHSTIRWVNTGQNYSIDGETSALFFSLLSFKSEGAIDAYGVSPQFYTEKRFRKAPTNTHFHRNPDTISFSSSTASYPRKGGEQDRASIIWQLAGIGRGNKDNIFPGAMLNFLVAGVRDADIWHIQVLGEEQIRVSDNTIDAWHFLRMPQPGSYDQKLDIWLVPKQEWLPARIRYTEKNGDTIDMVLADLPIRTSYAKSLP